MDLSSLKITSSNLKLVESSILLEAVRSVLAHEGHEELVSSIKAIKRNNDRINIRTNTPILNAEMKPYASKISREIYTKLHPLLPEVKEFSITFT